MTRDISNPGVAGGDIAIWDFARYLASEGHVVRVVASRFFRSAKRETNERIDVVRLGGLWSLWYRTFLYYMRECRGHYDLVVTEGFGGSRIPRLAPLYVKEPVITEWFQIHRDLFAVQYPRWLAPALNALERLTAFVHRKTTLVVLTEEWRKAFQELGFPRENIKVIPVSIQDEWLAQNATGGLKGHQIVWIGKFRRYKSPDHIVQAMPKVLQLVPDARLILAGRHDDAAYERELQALVTSLGIEGSVEFRFAVTETEKHSLLRGSRVMALPSAVEGFGIVVLEANASGVPVVASSGVPQSVVESGKNGLRYPYGDVHTLAEAIARVLVEEDLYRSLSSGSQAFARHYTWQRVCLEYEALIRHVAGNQTQRRLASVRVQGD